MTAVNVTWGGPDVIAAARRFGPEIATVVWVLLNLAWMDFWLGWETLPFHFIYIGVALMYGIRSWPVKPTLWALGSIALTTGLLTMRAGSRGSEAWAELAEVPMMSLLFLAMVYHVERRRRAVEFSRRLADERAEGSERERLFFSRASHELLTPITIIRGHMDLLGRGGAATAEDITTTREVVVDELGRTESLIGELLLTAKLASGAMEREPVDVADLVRGVATRWLRLDQREWSMRIDVDGDLEGSTSALGRALDNLVENAYRHTLSGQRIAISASIRREQVVLAVEDGGSGIPDEALSRVFERFYRVSPSPSGGGAGLGLSIVKAVAESHGGEVRIDSAVGRGTLVEIILPRRLPPVG